MTLSDLDRWLGTSRTVQIRVPFSDGYADAFVRVYGRDRLTGAYHLTEWTGDRWAPRGAGAPREHVADWLERGSARVVPLYFDRFDLEPSLGLGDGSPPPTVPARRRRAGGAP